MLEGRVAWSAATLLRALSYPHADRADDVAEAIAVRDGRGLLERFLDRYGQRLRLRGNGLAPALESAASALTLHAAWDPWAGAVARSLRRDDPVPERTAVVAALHLTAGGSSLSPWSCFLYEPARLRFGRCLLPTVGLISLSVDGAGEPEIGFPPPGDRAIAPGSLGPETISSLEEALGLLGSAAPAYLRWVEWGLRDAVVVGARSSSPRSGVSREWPGVVYLSAPHEPWALAERLVREATHQYLHLAERVGPVDDGSDERSYWSPLEGKERPLSRLLAAYHAFGNVALFHRACVETGVNDRGYAAGRLAALLPALRTTEGHLWENRALTPAGRALLDPLMERLATLEG